MNYIIAGARLNAKDNSMYNLNCHIYTRDQLEEWLTRMSEEEPDFPNGDISFFNDLDKKGYYRFSTRYFMYVIKTEKNAQVKFV